MTELQQHPAWKFWLSLFFCFAQVVVGLSAMVFLMIRGSSVGSCGQGCDFVGFGYTLYGFAIFCFLVAVASIALLVLLSKRTWAWMIPGIAILIFIVAFFITNGAVDSLLLK